LLQTPVPEARLFTATARLPAPAGPDERPGGIEIPPMKCSLTLAGYAP
jgi:hypothetical protein